MQTVTALATNVYVQIVAGMMTAGLMIYLSNRH